MTEAKKPEQPPKKPTIYEAIPMITGLVSPIVKGRENKAQGYKFRGIDDVYAVLNLLFAEHGVSALPEILESTHEQCGSTSKGNAMWRHTVKIRYWLTDSYGGRVAAESEGEGQDSGDKSVGKSQSVAFKAMCFQVFCIPTGEKIEPNLDAEDDDPAVEASSTKAPAQKPKEDPTQAATAKVKAKMIAAKGPGELAVLDQESKQLRKDGVITEGQLTWLGGVRDKRLKEIAAINESAPS
jgi:hypothetical protein